MNNYRQKAHGVVIGINNYKDPKIANLTYARADAEGVYEVLTNPDLGRFSPENVILLLDEGATQRNIRTAIGTTLRRKADKDDLVYIYYAGHGSGEIDPKSQNEDGIEKYLVPVDAELDNLFATGIAMEEIQRFFYRLESKQVIFFIDSCYSGEAGGRTFKNPNYQKRAGLTSEFLDQLSGEGRLVVAACDVNEVSLETPRVQHGLFTYHLIEGLKGKADKDADGYVTLNELYNYIYEHVYRDSRLMGGSMHPVQKGAIRGQIYLSHYETANQKKARELYAEAISYYKDNKYIKSRTILEKVLELVPNHKQTIIMIEQISRKLAAEDEKQRTIRQNKQRKRQLLLDLASKKVLPDSIISKAMNVIIQDPSKITGYNQSYSILLDKLSEKKIGVGEFIEDWYKISNQIDDLRNGDKKEMVIEPLNTLPITEEKGIEPRNKIKSLQKMLKLQIGGIFVIILIPILFYFNAIRFFDIYEIFDYPDDYSLVYVIYILACITFGSGAIYIAKISQYLKNKNGITAGVSVACLNFYALINAILLITNIIDRNDLHKLNFLATIVFFLGMIAVFLSIMTYLETIKHIIVGRLGKEVTFFHTIFKFHIGSVLLIIFLSFTLPFFYETLGFELVWFYQLSGLLFSISGLILGQIYNFYNQESGRLIGWIAACLIIVFFSGSISGEVWDKKTGDSLPGVNVIVKDSRKGAATDIEGNYSIPFVPIGSYPIQAAYIGYNDLFIDGVLVLPLNITIFGEFRMQESNLVDETKVISPLWFFSWLPRYSLIIIIFIIFGYYQIHIYLEINARLKYNKK